MSWGDELWDKYDNVVVHVGQSTRELDTWYGSFFKERSKIENEYARSLRKLIKTYMPKEKKKNQDDDSTLKAKFRLILQELGYQAGQHELLADTYGKECSRAIEERLKDVKNEMKKLKKEADVIEKNLNQSYKLLDNKKQNYLKAHQELEVTINNFKKTEFDGTISRQDVDKMRAMSNKKTRESDDSKAQYAHQLIETNKIQYKYYYKLLPNLLNNLQSLDVGNCEFFKKTFNKCIEKEKDVNPIVTKCLEEMDNLIRDINADQDSELVIDRLKTGNVPPADFAFEELVPGMEGKTCTEKRNTLSRGRSKQALHAVKGNINYFQRKRELEKKIEAQESEVLKGQNEMKSLQLMIQAYTQNPKFGDAKQFQGELDTAAHRTKLLESDLHSYQTELIDIIKTLENMKNQSPLFSNTKQEKSPIGSHTSSILSAQVSLSSTSGSMDSGPEQLKHQGPDSDSGIYLTANSMMQTSGWEEEAFDDVSTPPPKLERFAALYPFESDSFDTIPMVEGEEFVVVESDQDGWTKVRRVDTRYFDDAGEGFVPTSFIQSLH